ncbi:hypothetical protein EEB18_006085 [Sphingopyxis sp. OPL5]|uniref:hypothetical protein n=1 Tax=Sphingopyxis sp. OPL5 TaxID=2486273 RepID=UPI00164D9AA6|nr:hypothetical protein [Sphingopyxis sp. OPL5]QNO28517.1 hypothetical protein EEB18_006085 [Sphingopyxis sp. OPL5]
MTEPTLTAIPCTKRKRTLFLLATASVMALPQQAQACRTGRLLLETERQQSATGTHKQARLRVEEALIRKDGNPADQIAYRMLVIEGDGKLRTGDHIVVAAPAWGDHCLFWMGEPDAKGVVEGYATVPARAAGETYYWLSPELPRSTATLESYRSHPDRFVWRRVRFTAPWESAPSQ